MKKSTRKEKFSKKDTTLSEWERSTPDIIMFLVAASHLNMPVGGSMIERAEREHPEYFYNGGLQLTPKK